MATVIWSERTVADIEEIFDYIAHDSPTYARYQAERLVKAAERLQWFPESGRRLSEFPYLPHRELIVGN